MAKQMTPAELIAEARERLTALGMAANPVSLTFCLAEALEAADQRATELAAVVEKVRVFIERQSGWFRYRAEPVSTVLATAPADALRVVKAEAWEEGHDAGWEDRHQDALAGWMTSGPHESEAVNPYREGQS